MPNPTPTPVGRLVSSYANDPEMRELVELFVSELPQRIGQIEDSWRARELARLRTAAHQLKGASGGYGFPALGKVAAALEETVKPHVGGHPGDADLDAIRKRVDDLVAICRRAIPTP